MSIAMTAVGAVLALVSLFANQIGIGVSPGLGWKKISGIAVGAALAILGAVRLARKDDSTGTGGQPPS
jgi:hypothetical protein